jgi:hypothetical protein
MSMQLPERRINSQSKVTVRRMLPLAGELLVQRNQTVEASTPVARAQVPHRYHMLDIARQLASPNLDMAEVMLKAEGDVVEANEVIAAVKGGGLSFLQRKVRAPAAGTIATIGQGWVLLETDRTEVELLAFINGIVSRLIPDRGVIIEASGSVVEAACGFGGEAYGPLKRLVNTSFDILSPEVLDDSLKDAIILAGQSVDEEILRRAEEKQIRGFVVGSIDAALLKLDPPVNVKVVATEGFGDLPMSDYTFGLLGTLAGREVSIRGHTPNLLPVTSRASEDYAPVIMATSGKASTLAALSTEKEAKRGLVAGSRVRVTRGRYFGASGTVKALPATPQTTEIGLAVPSAQINLPDALAFIPLINLEQIV